MKHPRYKKLDKIKALRHEYGLTTKQLAEKLNYNAKYVSQIENGLAPPSLGFMRKIKEVYHEINIDEMFFSDI